MRPVANRAGTAADGRAAASPWTRAPEQAARYGLAARLSDMLHGWLDGRRGIPVLPPVPDPADSADGTPGGEPNLGGKSDGEAVPASGPAPLGEPAQVSTQRMKVLSSLAGELIALEETRLIEDRSALERQAARFLADRDALSRDLALAEARLRQATNPLTIEQREDRRFAERDAQARPVTLIRARRHSAWERRLGAAEQQHKSVLARFAEADRQAKLRQDLIRDRIELAQADARRQYELALRRIATYAQQLVRTHPQGRELNRLLLSHPVGPELPAWTDDPNTGVPQTTGPGSGPNGKAGDQHRREEKGSA